MGPLKYKNEDSNNKEVNSFNKNGDSFNKNVDTWPPEGSICHDRHNYKNSPVIKKTLGVIGCRQPEIRTKTIFNQEQLAYSVSAPVKMEKLLSSPKTNTPIKPLEPISEDYQNRNSDSKMNEQIKNCRVVAEEFHPKFRHATMELENTDYKFFKDVKLLEIDSLQQELDKEQEKLKRKMLIVKAKKEALEFQRKLIEKKDSHKR